MSNGIIKELKRKLSNFKTYDEKSNSVEFRDVYEDGLCLKFVFGKTRSSMRLYFPLEYRSIVDTEIILRLNEENVSFHLYKQYILLAKTLTKEEVAKLETMTADEIISEVARLYNLF